MVVDAQSKLPGEIGSGDMLRLGDLADRFGVRVGTAFRWIMVGLPAANGDRAYLEAIKRGRGWITSEAAVSRFFAELPRSPSATSARGTNVKLSGDESC